MYISIINKLGFIHIPKNGGSTISRVLSQHLTYFDILVGGVKEYKEIDHHYHRNFKISKHSTYEQMKKYTDQFEINWFTIFREPISRVVSIYKFSKKERQNLYIGYDYRNINTFIQSDRFINSNGVDLLHASQSSFLKVNNKLNEEIKIFPLENLTLLSNYLSKALDKKIDISIKENVSTANESFNLEKKSIEIIYNKYSEDFDLYQKLNS